MELAFSLACVGRRCAYFFLLPALLATAQDQTIQIDWQTRTAGCPAKLTAVQSVKLHISNVNDMVIDLSTGERLAYLARVRGTPASAAPPENPFSLQSGSQQACSENAQSLASLMVKARAIVDPRITPSSGDKKMTSIALSTTLDAIKSHKEFTDLLNAYSQDSCKPLFSSASDKQVADWIARFSGDHSIDETAVLNPDQNYHFYITESWKQKAVEGAKMDWKCGDTDIWTMSVGPMITTLPYRTYNSVKVPGTGASTTTTNVISVSGNSNVNVMGAALLNLNIPNPTSLDWTGLALSAGPVYAFSSAPSVSKLGLFAGVSIQLYKSFFVTPGVHIGEFADYPAGFGPGSVVPADFGTLSPVTRNTAKFAIGLTFKTSTFKKSTNQGSSTPQKSDNANQKNQPVQNNNSSQTVVQPNSGQSSSSQSSSPH